MRPHRPQYYRLNPDHSVEPIDVEEGDFTEKIAEIGKAFESERHIAFTQFDDIDVSTVFLVLDHGMYTWQDLVEGEEWKLPKPVLFETMVFSRHRYHKPSTLVPGRKFKMTYESLTRRYCTYEEAMAGHKAVCKLVTLGEAGQPDGDEELESPDPQCMHIDPEEQPDA